MEKQKCEAKIRLRKSWEMTEVHFFQTKDVSQHNTTATRTHTSTHSKQKVKQRTFDMQTQIHPWTMAKVASDHTSM